MVLDSVHFLAFWSDFGGFLPFWWILAFWLYFGLWRGNHQNELDKLRYIALKAVRAATKLKDEQCVHSSDQFFIFCEDKTPITTEP